MHILGNTRKRLPINAAGALAMYLAARQTQTADLIVEPLIQVAGEMAMYHPRFHGIRARRLYSSIVDGWKIVFFLMTNHARWHYAQPVQDTFLK